MPLRILVRHNALAPAQPEALLHEILCSPHDRGGRERPEVERSIVPHYATGGEHRELQGSVRAQREVALVVAHEYVEVRLVALYERRLREQGLGLVLHGHELEVGDRMHHRPHLRRVLCARTEIAAHTVAQVLRLPDVDDRAATVSHEIASGLVRQCLQPFSQCVGQRYASADAMPSEAFSQSATDFSRISCGERTEAPRRSASIPAQKPQAQPPEQAKHLS